MIAVGLPLFACLAIWYGGIGYEQHSREPHMLAQPFTRPLKAGDFSTQSSHIWNWGAPLAGDVAWRISKRDVRGVKPTDIDLYSFPRSLLLHEADQNPSNFSVAKLAFQLMLFISCAVILKTYVIPLF